MALTPYLGGTLLPPGIDNPENGVNLLATILAKGVAGRLSVSLAGLTGNQFLNASDSTNRIFTLAGTQSGAITLHLTVTNQEANNPFLVYNNSAGSVTIKLTADGTTAAGTGISVAQGSAQWLFHDGTNVYSAGASFGISGQAPAARVFHSATQSIATATVTVLAFNSERFDTDAIHDNATNNSRLTCKTAGLYSIFCALSWVSNATGYRQAIIRLNGATLIAIDSKNAISGDTTKHAVSTVYQLAVGDYIEVMGYQTSGGALNVDNTAAFSCEFGLVRVGG